MSYIQKIQQSLALNQIRRWFIPSRRRLIWRTITIGALISVFISLVYTWDELPDTRLELTPFYLIVAVGVYIFTYIMHLMGWHALATLTFGKLPLRDNIEAIAASDLVKYLPTVAWYIANRIHFYDQRQIPRKSVIAASLLEMIVLLGSGGIVLLGIWTVQTDSLILLFAIPLVGIISIKLGGSKIRYWWNTHIRLYQLPFSRQIFYWVIALWGYGMSWLVGALFLTFVLRTFTFVVSDDYWLLLNIWLVAGLAGTIVSYSIGTVGVAREATLTFLLARYWPLSASIAVAVIVKIILTVGQIGCALFILSGIHIIKKIKNQA